MTVNCLLQDQSMLLRPREVAPVHKSRPIEGETSFIKSKSPKRSPITMAGSRMSFGYFDALDSLIFLFPQVPTAPRAVSQGPFAGERLGYGEAGADTSLGF